MRWLAALLLAIAACAKVPVYTAPVMPFDLSGENAAGKTICSMNNLPVALIHPEAWDAWTREFILLHEQKHAADMYKFKGGCWAWVYRYNEDAKFRFDSEYAAYCLEGQFSLTRNANPREVWERMKSALSRIDLERALKMPNCIY